MGDVTLHRDIAWHAATLLQPLECSSILCASGKYMVHELFKQSRAQATDAVVRFSLQAKRRPDLRRSRALAPTASVPFSLGGPLAHWLHPHTNLQRRRCRGRNLVPTTLLRDAGVWTRPLTTR